MVLLKIMGPIRSRRSRKCGYCGRTIKKGTNYCRLGSAATRYHCGQCVSKKRKQIHERRIQMIKDLKKPN